jgi:hypothetical protein
MTDPQISPSPTTLDPAPSSSRLGDRIRGVAAQLRQESDIQIKATSRILAASAQIAHNHDQLIAEVVDMVEDDLAQQGPEPTAKLSSAVPYTVERLKQQFPKLEQAKAHFGIKAGSWDKLVAKLNQPLPAEAAALPPNPDTLLQRLDKLEHQMQTLQNDLQQVLGLLNAIAQKVLP